VRAREREKKREMQKSEGGERGKGKGKRIGTKETGKNEPEWMRKSRDRTVAPTISLTFVTLIVEYRSIFKNAITDRMCIRYQLES